MHRVLVVAPHPDDETLGCGGTLLKHKQNGDAIFWLIVTEVSEELGFTAEYIESRHREIDEVAQYYGFRHTYKLDLPTTRLDTLPMGDLVSLIGEVIRDINPDIIYAPFIGDIHSDHKVVFHAVLSCTKWFRYPSIKRILCYEALSETEFGMDPTIRSFQPNVFVDITDFFSEKNEIMQIYKSELGIYPFPRSEEAIEAQAMIRGTSAGVRYAESFMLLKEIL